MQVSPSHFPEEAHGGHTCAREADGPEAGHLRPRDRPSIPPPRGLQPQTSAESATPGCCPISGSWCARRPLPCRIYIEYTLRRLPVRLAPQRARQARPLEREVIRGYWGAAIVPTTRTPEPVPASVQGPLSRRSGTGEQPENRQAVSYRHESARPLPAGHQRLQQRESFRAAGRCRQCPHTLRLVRGPSDAVSCTGTKG